MDGFRLISSEDYNDLKTYLSRNELECSDLSYRFLSQGVERDPADRKSGVFYGNYEEGALKGVFFFANNKILLCHYESDDILKRVVLLKALKHYKPKMIIGAEEYAAPIWELLRKSLVDCKYIEGLFMECNADIPIQNVEEIELVRDFHGLNMDEVIPFLVEVEKAFGRKTTMINNLKEKALKKVDDSSVVYILNNKKIVAQGMIEFKTKGLAQIGGVYVKPEYRRKGYAEIVMRALTSEIVSEGMSAVLIVEKRNEAAINLYKKLGYIPRYKHVTLEMNYN